MGGVVSIGGDMILKERYPRWLVVYPISCNSEVAEWAYLSSCWVTMLSKLGQSERHFGSQSSSWESRITEISVNSGPDDGASRSIVKRCQHKYSKEVLIRFIAISGSARPGGPYCPESMSRSDSTRRESDWVGPLVVRVTRRKVAVLLRQSRV